MKKHGPGFFLKAITLLGIAVLALSACGGGDSGDSGGGTPTASPVGEWVGSYQDNTNSGISNIELDFKSNMTAQAWHNGGGSGMDFAYLEVGNTVTFKENWALFGILSCVSGGVRYSASNGSGTITGNTMTVIYTTPPGTPCTAGGTITLTKLP